MKKKMAFNTFIDVGDSIVNSEPIDNYNYYVDCRNFALASNQREKAAYLNKIVKDEKLLGKGIGNLNIKTKIARNSLPTSLDNSYLINDCFANLKEKSL